MVVVNKPRPDMPGRIPSVEIYHIDHLRPEVVVVAIKVEEVCSFDVVVNLDVKVFGGHALVFEESLRRHV